MNLHKWVESGFNGLDQVMDQPDLFAALDIIRELCLPTNKMERRGFILSLCFFNYNTSLLLDYTSIKKSIQGFLLAPKLQGGIQGLGADLEPRGVRPPKNTRRHHQII